MPLMEIAADLGIKKTSAQYFYSVLKQFNKMGIKVTVWEN